jgi:hypothetical protein
MAGNANSGRNPAFHLSEAELEKKINEYREAYKAGEFARMSAPHFFSFIGCLQREASEFIKTYSEDQKNTYYKRARMLEGMLQEIQGEIFSSHSWSNQQAGLAKIHLSKDHGDGSTYTEKEAKGSGKTELVVLFGNGDERAKDAAK